MNRHVEGPTGTLARHGGTEKYYSNYDTTMMIIYDIIMTSMFQIVYDIRVMDLLV